MQSIGVIGGGAWGTALAAVACRAGRRTLLWALESEVVDAINARHINPLYLPDVTLDKGVVATADIGQAAACDIVLLVVPAQHLRKVTGTLAAQIAPGTPVVICAKGIELGTSLLLSEVAAVTLPRACLMVLSGPTFAAEVARGLPTALTLAATDQRRGRDVAEALSTPTFRPYLTADVVGAEVGGAVKNVLAIACGIADGKQLGASARAALLARGLAEIVRLAVVLGGEPETLMGLSGLGDLVLTATSPQSRNYSLGLALGRGESLAAILGARRAVTEGVATASAVVALATKRGVAMPICAAVDQILNQGARVDDVMRTLLERPLREERDHVPS